jgi:hypothetical protein
MVSDEALKKLQEQIAAWPMTQRFVVQQLIEDYRMDREGLRVYEDTKLTPEEIDMDHEAAEQLRRLCRDFDLDRLEELVKADKDGRLAVLLCKPGDTVYFALLGRIIEKQVFSIVSFSNSIRIYCDGTSEYFRPEDIGETFFLTSEEAEKVLEAMKNG